VSFKKKLFLFKCVLDLRIALAHTHTLFSTTTIVRKHAVYRRMRKWRNVCTDTLSKLSRERGISWEIYFSEGDWRFVSSFVEIHEKDEDALVLCTCVDESGLTQAFFLLFVALQLSSFCCHVSSYHRRRTCWIKSTPNIFSQPLGNVVAGTGNARQDCIAAAAVVLKLKVYRKVWKET